MNVLYVLMEAGHVVCVCFKAKDGEDDGGCKERWSTVYQADHNGIGLTIIPVEMEDKELDTFLHFGWLLTVE